MATVAPSGLGCTSISTSQINLSWTNNDTYVTVTIQRKTGGGSFSSIDTVTFPATTYSDTSCSSNTQYTYRIYAIAAIPGAYSNEDSAYTYPTAPTIGSITTTGTTTLTANWTNNDTYNAVKVNRDGSDIATKSGSATSHGDTGLSSATTYTYKVRGQNTVSGLNSAYSSTANGTTLAAAPSGMSVSTVSGESGETGMSVSWSVNDTYTSVKLERKEGSGSWALAYTLGGTATTKTDSGLTSATKYSYRAYGVTGAGNTGYSNEDYDYTRPDQPSSVSATAVGSNQIDLAWTNGDTYSNVYVSRKKSGDPSYSLIDTITGTDTSYEDTGVDSDTQYYYYLYGAANGRNSVYSSVVNATTNEALASVVSDTITMTDSVTSDVATLDTILDTITMTDAVTSVAGISSTVTDTITMTDSVSSSISIVTDIAAFLGSDDGKVYKLSGDYTADNGVSIPSIIEMKQLDFNDQFPQYRDFYKMVDQVRLWYVDLSSDTELTLSVSTDGGVTWDDYTNTVGASESVAKNTEFFFRKTALTFKFRITHSSTTESIQLLGMNIFFKPSGKYF